MATTSVTGTDGVQPIYQPSSRWTQWALTEIYQGQAGTNKYVPNVGDFVIDLATDDYYKVTAVNATTLIATLVLITGAIPSGELTDTDVLLGNGPGTQSDTYRLYQDTSTTPPTLAIDNRLYVHGSMASTYQIFRGSLLDGTAVAVSAIIDTSGNITTQSIPLELAAIPSGVNYTIKSCTPCQSTVVIPNGEIVTVVIYSATGYVVSKQQLLVENTAFIRSTNAALKYITGISLSSPWLSNSDPTQILYPLNVPVSGLNLLGIVNYSDGTSITLPIDGTKFSMEGLNGFVATVVSQEQDLVLQYNLSSNELALAQANGSTYFITKAYTAITQASDGNYTVKLYAYPVWIDASNGYTLVWLMYNLDRNIYYDVTAYVSLQTNTRAFNPTQYGTSQQLTVQVNLNAVNGSYQNFLFVQTINIVLIQAGNNKGTNNWTIGFTTSQSPPYGGGVFAATTVVNSNLGTISVAGNFTTQADWLQALYYNTLPVYNPTTESGPILPTHFSIYQGSTLLVKSAIANWQTVFQLSQTIQDLSNVLVRFTSETSSSVLELSVAGVQCQQAT